VSCVEFHEDGHLLATRGTDDCVKLWDAREFSQPLKVLLLPTAASSYAWTSFAPIDATQRSAAASA
jgi:WD40 repeat protein